MKSLQRTWAGISAALAVGLPLAGITLAGLPRGRYLEFPPRTQYIEHAGFSWTAFFLLAAGLAAGLIPFLRRLHGTRASAPARGAFPWWGWAGLAAGAASWLLAWSRFTWFAPRQPFTFSPLWFSYILVVNAWTRRRTGRCMMTDQPGRFLALLALSAGFWWYFEYLNRFVQNWHYEGIAELSAWEYFLFATLPFSTVLPAVLGTFDLLASFPALGAGWDGFRPWRVRCPRTVAGAVIAVGAISLGGIGVWPDYLFPMLWISPLMLITALQSLAGRPTIFAPIAEGRWRRIGLLALSALVCGVFWEMWNFHSLAKWVYTVPFVQRFHLFEMPLLGYAGYLPFGLECAVIAAWAGWDAGCALRDRRQDGDDGRPVRRDTALPPDTSLSFWIPDPVSRIPYRFLRLVHAEPRET